MDQQTEQPAVSAADLREKLTAKERKFAESYLENGFNSTQAAISAGYKNGTSIRQVAHEVLTKPYVRDYITATLRESAITPDEVREMISDLSKSSLNNYMITRQVEHTPKIKVSLSVVIASQKEQIEFEQECLEANRPYLSDDEIEATRKTILHMQSQVRRLEVEFQRNHFATRIVNGPTELVDVAELDVVALARDKKLGRIKSFKQTKDGVQVETYPADGPLLNLAKIMGIAPKEGETNVNVVVNLAPGEAKAISEELDKKY